MNTVSHIELHNIWGGKVIVDEVRQFCDNRGMLAELWRTDDEKTKSLSPVMSYWSYTNPYIQRGFHKHSSQCDWFFSWYSRMVYQLYNEETKEMFHFITEPDKIYRIKVDSGIIHSYRNLDNKPSLTGNFPSSLFMGEHKKSPIDETRYEETFKDIPTYIIIGAGGRLGKALVNNLYKDMGFQKYNIIPVYEKFKDKSDVDKLFDNLFNKDIFSLTNCYVINCAAITDTSKYKNLSPELTWTNIVLPTILAHHCNELNISFYQISSDYIFRVGDESGYTQSKKEMESIIKDISTTHLIRVANLFSLDEKDTLNILSKVKQKIKTGDTITSNPDLLIFPTEVSKLAKEIINYINAPKLSKEQNICGKPYTLETLCYKFLNTCTTYTDIFFKQNSLLYLSNAIIIDCDEEIKNKIV